MPGNFASRIQCKQCGQAPPAHILNLAMAEDKLAKFGVVRPAKFPKPLGSWKNGAPLQLQPQWKEFQQMQQKLQRLQDKLDKEEAANSKFQQPKDLVSVLECLKDDFSSEGEGDMEILDQTKKLQSSLLQRQEDKKAAVLKEQPWSKKWQISSSEVAKIEKKLEQTKVKADKAIERFQQAKVDVEEAQALIASTQTSLEKASAAHQALLATKDEAVGGMDVDEGPKFASFNLEKITKNLTPEQQQKPEISRAVELLHEALKESAKEQVKPPEFAFPSTQGQDEVAAKMSEILLTPGGFEKLQAMYAKIKPKTAEEQEADPIPEGDADAAGVDDNVASLMGAMAKSLADKTSKSNRYQPYSG